MAKISAQSSRLKAQRVLVYCPRKSFTHFVIPDLIRNPVVSLRARFHPRGGSTPEGGLLGRRQSGFLLEFIPYLIRGGNDNS
jgi:hypothetical protein